MPVPLFTTPASPPAGGDARRWEDEIVYGVIIEKFFNGDPANDIMRNAFFQERHRYQGGYWGGDLKGVIAKLDDLTDLGVSLLGMRFFELPVETGAEAHLIGLDGMALHALGVEDVLSGVG